MIVKFIGAFLIIFSCSSIGFIEKYKYSLRINELENFIQCMNIFSVEVCYSLENIETSLDKICTYATDNNREIFNDVKTKYNESSGVPISEIWINEFEKNKNKIYKHSDMEILKGFGYLLGNGSIETQEENIENLKKKLNLSQDNLRKEESKVSSLSKIGMYAGIIIVILLI